MKVFFPVGPVLLFIIVLAGCSEPPVPPEVQLALAQQQDLRRIGAAVYAPESYEDFAVALKSSRDHFSAEQSHLAWFRDYQGVTENFRMVLALGEQVRREIVEKKAQQAEELINRSTRIAERLRALRDLVASVRDSRLNTGNLSRIEVLLDEAKRFTAAGQPQMALDRLAEAETLLGKTVGLFRPVLAQYLDEAQVSRWKALVDDVVDESRRSGGYAIVVNKLRRQLILYHKGTVVATYPIGLGFKPIGDKLYAGDQATPEGRYRVVSKLPNSRYYRALLINYPNAEDQQRFAEAKRRKRIPANARIGGLIEIHGGGKDGATLGCIGLNDNQMLELFRHVEVGTPVVIVAAMSTDNLVRLAMRRIQ